jgi:hypothetical protein
MCTRFSRACPGLADEPLFVDMTKTARHGMQKRKKPSEPASREVFVYQQEPATIDWIGQAAILTEAFYARFLSYFTSEGESREVRHQLTWLHRLPHFSTDGTNDALTLAVQATASSYCATETNNLALARHAMDLYGRAIHSHARFLARSGAGMQRVTVHMISTSLLFSFFEAMQATSAEAYRLHIYGAAKMFEITSPRECAQGILCQIFFHLRTQMAFVQLTAGGGRMPVDVSSILYKSLEYEELPMFQRLTSHLTTLAEVYNGMEEVGYGRGCVYLVEYVTVRSSVDALWHEYTEAASAKNEILSWWDPESDTTRYRDAFTALMISYFSATRILLAVIAPQLAASFLDFTDHNGNVLQAALYLQTCRIGCAYMRMAAPLLLVAVHAPKAEQRRIAIGCFESWNTGSMRGISALALESIHRRRQVIGSRLETRARSVDTSSIASDEGVCMEV